MRSVKLLILTTMLALTGCMIDLDQNDFVPPGYPTNVMSVTGDDEVTIQWSAVYDYDLDGYRIYRSTEQYSGHPLFIGFTNQTYYVDRGVNNGTTYYYYVTAVDRWGNESPYSQMVFDTPRPEGYSVKIWDYYEFEDNNGRYSGYDFSSYRPIMSADPYCDFYLEYRDGRMWLFVGTAIVDNPYHYKTYIYDYGYSSTFDIKEVNYAPRGDDPRWEGDRLEAKQGHLYVMWTWDDHAAAIWLKELNSEFAVFDWAYQSDYDNPELAPIREEVKITSETGSVRR